MDVCREVLCVVTYRYLRRADHSSRGVLPTVVRRVCDLENLVNEAMTRVGSQRHRGKKKNPGCHSQVEVQEIEA